MEIVPLGIPEVKLIRPVRHGDGRGFFSEVYSRQALEDAGISADFVQDNHSRSQNAGTVRGLHFQRPPAAQVKLVRVVRGRVFDVTVDLRRGAPTFGRHVSVELSADNWAQILVPIGFAHGFCTLEPGTEVLYKLSAYYAPEHAGGVLWTDPDLGIDWPVARGDAIISEKDGRLPRLKELKTPF